MFFEVKGLCFSYYKRPLCLKDVCFSVNENSKTLILASKDMGKTTFLKVISGFETSRFGSILLENKDINKIDDKNKKFSLVLSDVILLESKTIKQNLDFQCEASGIENLSDNEIEKYLKDFYIEKNFDEKVKKLTLFEKRKLQIIRSLIKKPRIIFLDDQFKGLADNDEINEMIQIYKTLIDDKNLTVFMTIGDESYKKVVNKFKEYRFDKVFYLNLSKMYEFKSLNEFENSFISLDLLNFINNANLIEGYIEKDKGSFWFCRNEKRLFKFDSNYNYKLNNLKLEFGEIEECFLYAKVGEILENFDFSKINKYFENGEIYIFSKVTNERLI